MLENCYSDEQDFVSLEFNIIKCQSNNEKDTEIKRLLNQIML